MNTIDHTMQRIESLLWQAGTDPYRLVANGRPLRHEIGLAVLDYAESIILLSHTVTEPPQNPT